MIPGPQAGTHTITCFRNSTKCKVCKEVILKAKKREHLEQWRNQDLLIREIREDCDEKVNLFFDHGLDVNLKFKADEHKKRSPIHYAAINGSLNTLLALIS